ncbi:protein mono-ADP-ribosyltransferase PARP11-like [Hyalella azteca]|uniref:Poly [ADP-ribose] polymerase n=1 Tax=Hyalella azteca TaxID=294128 RepID=A0A979FFK4_HYAAZ|nr:protein mono-ADP-ribosyltransferase PARP11-like [Hyalella azteca]
MSSPLESDGERIFLFLESTCTLLMMLFRLSGKIIILFYPLLVMFFKLLYWLFCMFFKLLYRFFCTFFIASPQRNGNRDEFSSVEYEWFFCDENNQWIKYGQISSGNDTNYVPSQGSDDIEKHYQTQPRQVMTIKSRQHTYELNFMTMTQTNLGTKVQRPICRIVKNAGSNNGSGAVSMHVAYEWYFKEDDESWVKFDSKGNTVNTGAIERQFRSDPKTKFKFTAGIQSYVLNFIKMTQTNTSTGKVREVRRPNQPVSLTASSPSIAQISSGQKCSTMSLPANHAEYTKVLKLLKTTLPKCNPISIVKINNPYLETAFKNRKIQLQNQYPSVKYKEEYLFHGTKPANVKAILEDNIDWRLHGSCTGHIYGRGAYFSNDAKMSHFYGNAIFVCKVLVGLTVVGNSNTVKPAKDKSNRPIDTTVNDAANPTIFVKYDSQEYYPEYYAEC